MNTVSNSDGSPAAHNDRTANKGAEPEDRCLGGHKLDLYRLAIDNLRDGDRLLDQQNQTQKDCS